jgi:hypothetical protein
LRPQSIVALGENDPVVDIVKRQLVASLVDDFPAMRQEYRPLIFGEASSDARAPARAM